MGDIYLKIQMEIELKNLRQLQKELKYLITQHDGSRRINCISELQSVSDRVDLLNRLLVKLENYKAVTNG